MSHVQTIVPNQSMATPHEFKRSRRRLGSFYTPRSAADYLADWIVRRDGEHILEPSFGDGIFLRAVADAAARSNATDLRIVGAEIDPRARRQALEQYLINEHDAYLGDFLAMNPVKVHAVIGNPPYVRLRHLPSEQQATAMRVAETLLLRPMDPAGSVWMPFLLHSMRCLHKGGRLAFVLPYELTYVRYARRLWYELGRNFGSLRIQRTHERLFPDLLQEAVILLADKFGATTDIVLYEAYERVDDLLANEPQTQEVLRISDITNGDRVFTLALLHRDLRHLLATEIPSLTAPTGEFVRFGIGYVSGDKTFFHPDPRTVAEFDLPKQSLYPTVTSGRALKGGGVQTSTLHPESVRKLFLPNPKMLTSGERSYIRYGETAGVSNRYKCRIRDPWYVVPGIRVPDLILGVFTERPILVANDASVLASNSLLAGISRGWSGNDVVTRWYTSLTLLQCELEVHALGGGVMVMVPNEANRVRLPRSVASDPEHYQELDRLLRVGAVEDAYGLGDRAVLLDQLRLTPEHLTLIREGVNTLAHWRTSARSSKVA